MTAKFSLPGWIVSKKAVVAATVVAVSCGRGNGAPPAAAPVASHSREVDACRIVTQEDASSLFGRRAFPIGGGSRESGLAGYCQWGWESGRAVGALEIRVWNAVRFRTEPQGWAKFDIGERGYIRVESNTGERAGPDVEIVWVQERRTYAVSYTVVGRGDTGEPDPQKRADELKVLLLKAMARR